MPADRDDSRGGPPAGVPERRRDLFRSLIDDMIQQIRPGYAGPWPPDERARRADLERIMAQVRNATLQGVTRAATESAWRSMTWIADAEF
jgi:hypothetical protein